jgi:hypothetical protein
MKDPFSFLAEISLLMTNYKSLTEQPETSPSRGGPFLTNLLGIVLGINFT